MVIGGKVVIGDCVAESLVVIDDTTGIGCDTYTIWVLESESVGVGATTID